uniref:Thyroglobulin type-1 domain-containing protein n=1 Tax=Poecilia mexicana TaxID=48701 RepID=A0A3B3XBZ8_9TELE
NCVLCVILAQLAQLRRKTLCEHHRDSVPTTSPDGVTLFGAYVPQCDENGLYVPKQCHGSSGYCWCVDSRGQERTATRTGPGLPSIDCRFGETLNLIRSII